MDTLRKAAEGAAKGFNFLLGYSIADFALDEHPLFLPLFGLAVAVLCLSQYWRDGL